MSTEQINARQQPTIPPDIDLYLIPAGKLTGGTLHRLIDPDKRFNFFW